jgi:thiosulfate/3-mercaptopyruvate sulfurtransferase
VNLPYAGNLDEDRRFLDAGALRRRFEAAGVSEDRETIVYCGSGVTATHDLLALEAAGFERVRLFPGSWSQWSADPDRPVAVGPNP